MNEKINAPTIKDVRENTLDKKNETRLDDILGKIEPNERLTPNLEILSQVKENYNKENNEIKRELTNEEKQKIKDETGWSNGIVDYIRSMKEFEIYKNAGLKEGEINGKKCLLRNDIDLEQKKIFKDKNLHEKEITNKELMSKGFAPLDKNGKPIELHHIGQQVNSPFAELTKNEHGGKGNYSILHDSTQKSEIDRIVQFKNEKREHWKTRSEI